MLITIFSHCPFVPYFIPNTQTTLSPRLTIAHFLPHKKIDPLALGGVHLKNYPLNSVPKIVSFRPGVYLQITPSKFSHQNFEFSPRPGSTCTPSLPGHAYVRIDMP